MKRIKLQRFTPRKVGANLEQGSCGVNRRFSDQRRLRSILLRQHKAAARAGGAISHGERAADGAQFSGQRQFSRPFIKAELVRWNLAGCRQYAQCNRQIEAAAFLGQVSRGKIDCDAPGRKLKACILQRGPHAVLAFLTSVSGRPTMVKPGSPLAM